MEQTTETEAGWLSLAEAAEREGISLDAMRRRMRRGRYVRRQVSTRHGQTWQVRLDGDAQGALTVPPATEAPASSSHEVQALQKLVQVLEEQLAIRAREVERLHTLLAQAQQALPAPQEQPHMPVDAREGTLSRSAAATPNVPPQPPAPPPHRPWWAFWRA